MFFMDDLAGVCEHGGSSALGSERNKLSWLKEECSRGLMFALCFMGIGPVITD